MKKVLILVALLPVFALGAFDYGEFSVNSANVFFYTDYDVWPVRTQSQFYNNINSLDQLTSIFSSSKFGFKVQLRRSSTVGYDYTFKAPSAAASSLVIVSSSASLTNSILCSTNGVSVKVSPLAFAPLASLYQTSATLFALGYRGPAVEWFEGSSSNFCVNVDYPLLLSDVLSSTNTVFRRVLLSSLNSIQSNVSSLVDLFNDEVVPGFAFSNERISEIRDINNSILSNAQSSSSSLLSIDADMDTLIDRAGDILDKVSSDPFVNDFTNSVNALLSSGKISQAQASSLLSGYSSLGSPTHRAVFALSLKDSVNASQFAKDFVAAAADPGLSDELVIIGQSLGADVVDALIGDYDELPTRGTKAVNTRTSIKAQLRSWREEAKKQLNDWKDDLRQQLQDWKTSDETGYLNVREAITNEIEGLRNDNQALFNPDGSVTVNGTTVRGGSAFRYVVTNLSDSTGRQIAGLAGAVTNAINSFRDKLLDGNSEVGVRINFPLRYETSKEVNVHDAEVADAIRNGYINIQELKSAILEALNTSDPSVRIKGTNSIDWAPWFERWGVFEGTATNLFSRFNSADSTPMAQEARSFLDNGFDFDMYETFNWFQRVEVLLGIIADVSSSNSVSVTDISGDLDRVVELQDGLVTNVVDASSEVAGFFNPVADFSLNFGSAFGSTASPVTGEIELLPSGKWLYDLPLTLRIDPKIQNGCRLATTSFWSLAFLVVGWVAVSSAWRTVAKVFVWIWSQLDV